jgi:hypothetical protein
MAGKKSGNIWREKRAGTYGGKKMAQTNGAKKMAGKMRRKIYTSFN